MGAVFLVRHGQASFGEADYDRLSEPGREQAVAVGAELARRTGPFASVRCGSLARQRDTATLALGAAGTPAVAPSGVAYELVEDFRWNEYDHIDVLTHHSPVRREETEPRAFQAGLDAALADWVAAGEDGPCAETFPAFAARTRAALDEVIASLGKGEQGVVFTSGGVIGVLCAGLLGSAASGHTFLALQRVTVNGGITKLVSGRGGVHLLSFNEHAHFDGGPAPLTYR
ncbi:histidine phosphatase family protein [Amycolatopsis antarctica]|uniref:Histidine phosphatase family protein n=1 Tax=Amycolatopsis antarctica TaxID=1854586 RepID=A0A263CZR8_9PSEU|nr:histidine phosphatase family protein [Amycolatopsis antarctica]OZM71680.1 histidine phosphatase family protein [Amycolatopsis antarctica]